MASFDRTGYVSKKEANPCSVCTYGWAHHEVSGLGGFDCSCSRASFQGNHQYHAHRRRAFFVEAKVAVGKNKVTKASKATPAIDNCKGRLQRKALVDQVRVSGALSGACTGKGPQMANPRPTPKPGNLGPPWPPGTSGNPAGYSRGRRISDAIEGLIEEMAPDREFAATARRLECRQRSYVQ